MKTSSGWRGWTWAGYALRGSLLLAFLACSLLAAAGLGLVEGLRSPDTIQRLGQDTALTERYHSEMARFMVSYALYRYRTEWPVAADDQEFWGGVAAQVLPPGFAEAQFTQLAGAAQTWLTNGDQALPPVTLDLRPVKEHLLEPQGTLAALSLLQKLPTCPAGAQDFLYRDNGLPECSPETANRTAGAERTAAMLSKTLPDSASLDQLYQEGYLTPGSIETLMHLQAAYLFARESARTAGRLALLFLCGLLLASMPGTNGLSERLIKTGLAASLSAAALLALEGTHLLPPAVLRLLARPFVPVELSAWQQDLLIRVLSSGALQKAAFTAAGWALMAAAALLGWLAVSAMWQRRRGVKPGPKPKSYTGIKRTYRWR